MSFFSLQLRVIPQPQCTKLLRYKGSDGWFSKDITPKRCLRAMPFITKEGFISSNPIYFSKCTSTVWFSSVVSTVFDRLNARRALWSRGGNKRRPNHDLNFRIAVLYTLTLDGGFLSRVVECQKRNDQAAMKITYSKSRNVDAQTRFWYDQALKGASWFKRRGGNPRDKSTNNEDYRLIEVLDGPRSGECQRFIDRLTDPWIRKEVVTGSFRLTALINSKRPKVPLNAKPRKKFGVGARSRLHNRLRR